MLLYYIPLEPPLSHVQCAGVNGDNYQGAFSEPVLITVEPPESQEGIIVVHMENINMTVYSLYIHVISS